MFVGTRSGRDGVALQAFLPAYGNSVHPQKQQRRLASLISMREKCTDGHDPQHADHNSSSTSAGVAGSLVTALSTSCLPSAPAGRSYGCRAATR